MPSVSGLQHRFMAGCAHSPQHMQGKCPSPKVAKEFVAADKGKRFPAKAAGVPGLAQALGAPGR
jgi:hypothetical protein